jgi:hypothetical protein
MPACPHRASVCPRGVCRRRASAPLSKRPGAPSVLQYFHGPDAGLQRDKRAINVRLIYRPLRGGVWIISVFPNAQAAAGAFPGESRVMGAARQRNPQHFHRARTVMVPLRTSHPHVYAHSSGPAQLDAAPAGPPRARTVSRSISGFSAVCTLPTGKRPLSPPGRSPKYGLIRHRAHPVSRVLIHGHFRKDVSGDRRPRSAPGQVPLFLLAGARARRAGRQAAHLARHARLARPSACPVRLEAGPFEF